MPRTRLGHYVLGTAGLALLRTWMVGPRDAADRQMAELERLVALAGEGGALAVEQEVPEEDVESGYGRWAGTYDQMPNPLIALEAPAVHALIDARPAGRTLDAACGTGRHTRHLHARGHRVIGVDASAAMLAAARAALPDVDFRQGLLTALPVDDASMDLVVCALALTHCARLDAPIAEIARVLRPGGRLILSDFHPMAMAFGGAAFFVGGDGRPGMVRSFAHTHATYIAAFQAAGLDIRHCAEPLATDAELVAMSGGLSAMAEEAFRLAYLGLPIALVWELERR